MRVLLFEWHFYMLYGNEYEYDELVQKKNEYFDVLQNSVRVADRIHENAKATIKLVIARRQLSHHNEITLMFRNGTKHCPTKIEH